MRLRLCPPRRQAARAGVSPGGLPARAATCWAALCSTAAFTTSGMGIHRGRRRRRVGCTHRPERCLFQAPRHAAHAAGRRSCCRFHRSCSGWRRRRDGTGLGSLVIALGVAACRRSPASPRRCPIDHAAGNTWKPVAPSGWATAPCSALPRSQLLADHPQSTLPAQPGSDPARAPPVLPRPRPPAHRRRLGNMAADGPGFHCRSRLGLDLPAARDLPRRFFSRSMSQVTRCAAPRLSSGNGRCVTSRMMGGLRRASALLAAYGLAMATPGGMKTVTVIARSTPTATDPQVDDVAIGRRGHVRDR